CGRGKAGPQSASHNPRYELEMAFSRGLHTGWFRGINNQQLVHARFGKKRGVYLGQVTRVEAGQVFIRLQAPLKLGDGVVFVCGRPEEKEEGGRVYGMRNAERGMRNAERGTRNAETALLFGRGDIDFSRIHAGDKVWKTSDPELDRRLRATFEGEQPKFQRPIQVEVHGRIGQPLTLIVRDEIGHVVQIESAMSLAGAEKRPLT